VPDDELFAFHVEEVGRVAVQLLGRRLYETMRYWDTVEEGPETPPLHAEWARRWRALPKIVFSTTLDAVEDDARLERGDAVAVLERLRAEEDGEIAIGGAGLAASVMAHGLIDEYRLLVRPIVLGAGTPYFPPLERPIPLELVETRTFPGGVVYLRYS
jgi:dihydrofolate reductase